MNAMCVQVLWILEESTGFLGARVTGHCKLPNAGAGI